MAKIDYLYEIEAAAIDRMTDPLNTMQPTGKLSRLSIGWYQEKIKEFGQPTAKQLLAEGKLRGRPFVGKLNMFIYRPKLFKKLPYYDIFPLVLPLEFYTDGFLGINFHYLEIPIRVKLLDELTRRYLNQPSAEFLARSAAERQGVKINITYDRIRNVKLIRPTLHKYLKGHVKSGFREVDAPDFVAATVLPVQQFRAYQKSVSPEDVYRDSRQKGGLDYIG